MAAWAMPSTRPLQQAVYVSQKFTVPSASGTIPLSVSSPEPESARRSLSGNVKRAWHPVTCNGTRAIPSP